MSTTPRSSVDVVILGAGPAGCAAAILLRQRAHSVAILERERQPAFKVGEHLRPEALAELDALDLPARGRSRYLRQSPGIRVAWGSAEIRERDYLFDPRGAGGNVSRRELECALACRAAEAGALLLRGATRLDVERDADGSWRVTSSAVSDFSCLRARWLIDATGRRAWLARRLGSARERIDRLVALAGRLRVRRVPPDADRLLVESSPDGWWYSVVLPDGAMNAVYLTDADLIRQLDRDASRAWRQALERTVHTQRRISVGCPEVDVSVHAAETTLLTRLWGPGWVAAGDAAWTSDPLGGLGVSEAFRSARSVVLALDAALRLEDTQRFDSYARDVNARFDALLAARYETYRQDIRWTDRPFWQRRHVPPARIAPIALHPAAMVRLSPCAPRTAALGLARDHLEFLLTLAPTPRPAASVLRDFTARCPVDAAVALRALQALAEVS
jgi:flavin-dependent dehydrogenase